MKSTIKIVMLSLLVALSIEKPLQAALDPITVGATIAGATIVGGILGRLSSDKHSTPKEKADDAANGAACGFFASLIVVGAMIDAVTPVRTYTHYVPVTTYVPVRKTTTYTTFSRAPLYRPFVW